MYLSDSCLFYSSQNHKLLWLLAFLKSQMLDVYDPLHQIAEVSSFFSSSIFEKASVLIARLMFLSYLNSVITCSFQEALEKKESQ